MKTISGLGVVWLAGALLAGAAAAQDDAVAPATASIDCLRTQGGGSISGRFFRGTTLLFTNCQTFADAAGSVTQGLEGVEVEVRIGTAAQNTAYTAQVYNAEAGLWAASTMVPSNAAVNVQVKLTDSGTNIYIYPLFSLSTQEALE